MREVLRFINRFRIRLRIDIYCATIVRLAIVLLLMQQSRFLFYAFNKGLFPNTTYSDLPTLMAGGLVFDLAGLLYMNALFIIMQILPFKFTLNPIYRKVSKIVFVVSNGLLILANNLDIAYYPFTLRRSTALVFKEFSNESNGFALAWEFMTDYWYLFLISTSMIVGIALSYSSIKIKRIFPNRPVMYYPFASVMMFLTVVLFVGGVRGGFAHSTRPITISNASQYVVHAGEESIVLNTPFSLLRTSGEEPLPLLNYFDENTLNTIYSPIHKADEGAIMDKKNVVVIIWESLGSEYVGGYNKHTNIDNYKGYTPFLDSLLGHSTYFLRSSSSGKKSIDAMASIFSSIPSLIQPFVLSTYSNNRVPSLAALLKGEGYSTSFFHGAPNGSMGLMAYSNKLEMGGYYGKSEYDAWRPNNSDFDDIWGIWDDKFMEYFSYELDKMPQPFFSSVFTLSSHHPFKLPAEREGDFDEGTLAMHKVIGYTDSAMRSFFERAKSSSWYDNTIFVITGDHPNQSQYPYYNTVDKSYKVPIIIFDPSKPTQQMIDKVASHIDILPTVMRYLGYEKSFFSFGQNLLQEDTNNFIVGYMNGYLVEDSSGYLIYNNGVLESKTTQPTHLEDKAKAFIQHFNSSMINNKLYLTP